MAVLDSLADRRRHRRTDVPLTAVLFRRDAALGRFVVQNLSAGGALLTGRRDVSADERVRVVLPFPGREPLVLDGRVARRASAPNQLVALAIEFRHRSPRTEDAIQEALVSELDRRAHVRAPTVLVIQDGEEICRRLAQDARAFGRPVRIASTPLDAVRWLEDPEAPIDVAFVDVSAGEVDGLALLRFLADEYPTVRRILLQGAVRPSAAELMQTASLVDGVLAEPWDPETLRETLGETP